MADPLYPYLKKARKHPDFPSDADIDRVAAEASRQLLPKPIAAVIAQPGPLAALPIDVHQCIAQKASGGTPTAHVIRHAFSVAANQTQIRFSLSNPEHSQLERLTLKAGNRTGHGGFAWRDLEQVFLKDGSIEDFDVYNDTLVPRDTLGRTPCCDACPAKRGLNECTDFDKPPARYFICSYCDEATCEDCWKNEWDQRCVCENPYGGEKGRKYYRSTKGLGVEEAMTWWHVHGTPHGVGMSHSD